MKQEDNNLLLPSAEQLTQMGDMQVADWGDFFFMLGFFEMLFLLTETSESEAWGALSQENMGALQRHKIKT